MNVASLELCQELYKLSSWEEQECTWGKNQGQEWSPFTGAELSDYTYPGFEEGPPAYDLGYLLRKLPVQAYIQKQQDRYVADWKTLTWVTTTADTPEDAAAKLAIELFKANVLTP